MFYLLFALIFLVYGIYFFLSPKDSLQELRLVFEWRVIRGFFRWRTIRAWRPSIPKFSIRSLLVLMTLTVFVAALIRWAQMGLAENLLVIVLAALSYFVSVRVVRRSLDPGVRRKYRNDLFAQSAAQIPEIQISDEHAMADELDERDRKLISQLDHQVDEPE